MTSKQKHIFSFLVVLLANAFFFALTIHDPTLPSIISYLAGPIAAFIILLGLIYIWFGS